MAGAQIQLTPFYVAKRIFSSSARGLFILDNLGQSLRCFVFSLSWRCRHECRHPVGLQGDRFNPLNFFGGERELFRLEVFFHVLLACGSGQREHADLHGKAKDDLGGTRI